MKAISSLLLVPAAAALAHGPEYKPKSCVVKTVSVTTTITVDGKGSPQTTDNGHAYVKPAAASSPWSTYTYTSLKSCSAGEVYTWNGKTYTASAPTAYPTVCTTTWSDPKQWPATWTEIYTSLSTCMPGQTVTRDGNPYVLKSSSTSTCTLTSVHTGAPNKGYASASKVHAYDDFIPGKPTGPLHNGGIRPYDDIPYTKPSGISSGKDSTGPSVTSRGSGPSGHAPSSIATSSFHTLSRGSFFGNSSSSSIISSSFSSSSSGSSTLSASSFSSIASSSSSSSSESSSSSSSSLSSSSSSESSSASSSSISSSSSSTISSSESSTITSSSSSSSSASSSTISSSSSSVAPACPAAVTGVIAVRDQLDLTIKGYVRNTYDNQNSHTFGSLDNALLVTIPVTSCTALNTGVAISMLNMQLVPSVPEATYWGAVGGSGGYTFAPGQLGYAYIAGTGLSPANSPPSSTIVHTIQTLGYNAPAESSIWNFDYTTGSITATWVNVDGTSFPAQPFYDASVDFVGLTGDLAKFMTTFSGENAYLVDYVFVPNP